MMIPERDSEMGAGQGFDVTGGSEDHFVLGNLVVLFDELGEGGAEEIEVVAVFEGDANVAEFRQKTLSVFRF